MSANPAMIFQGVSAVMKMQSAQTEAKGIAAQASSTRLQARSEALKYKQQGVAVLRNILENDAAINARGAAGGIASYSGSNLTLSNYAMARGADEFFMTREGQTIALRTGEIKADQYMQQAAAVKQQAFMSAAFGLGAQQYSQSQLGSAPAPLEIYGVG